MPARLHARGRRRRGTGPAAGRLRLPPRRAGASSATGALETARIEALESEQAGLHAQMADPVFYRRPGPEIALVTQRAEAIAAELDEAFHRWGELESLRAG